MSRRYSAVGVVDDAGDRQQLGDAARREHQPVVAEPVALAGGVLAADPPADHVHLVDLTQDQPYAGQRCGTAAAWP
ncbi:hypothetical protein [Micromonospora sp. NPDC005806]|uniref:hypothetical protein n=1 Tax=Micromonospora sp. NPDC005806 TaxID=3364234 RepID=UPI003693D58F